LNYTRWSILCLLASIPFAIYVANRRSASAVAVLRVATFNVSLHRPEPGALLRELRGGGCEPARRIASIVQRTMPDAILLCEVDRDEAAEAAAVLNKEYFAVAQRGLAGIAYEFSYCGPVNTGEPSGQDLDRDGRVAGPGDAFGFGAFPGQYGMVLLSRHPILEDQVRTFRTLRWQAMPGALRPDGVGDDAWNAMRLSSKSHWDVPIGVGDKRTGGKVIHLLCSHPTPPVFDGPEDRNGRRNHDEIRFWVDYLTPDRAGWIVDDAGVRGGLGADAHFVVMGDLNCDPMDGDSRREALAALLAHPRVQDPQPKSRGGDEESKKQFGANARHGGDAALDTGDFADVVPQGPGNLRVDYVLPSKGTKVVGSGIFWPVDADPLYRLTGDYDPSRWPFTGVPTSDHRQVWVDLRY